jgi:bacteriocin-like protein
MKTNLVKTGSEKNIEMFKLTNEELSSINGGKIEIGYDDEGNPIVVVRPGISSFLKTFLNKW